MRVNFLAECDYAHGYQQALTDIKNWFNQHSESIKYYKMFNHEGVLAILSAMEMNAETMQKYGEDTEFRFEIKDKKLRLWIEK